MSAPPHTPRITDMGKHSASAKIVVIVSMTSLFGTACTLSRELASATTEQALATECCDPSLDANQCKQVYDADPGLGEVNSWSVPSNPACTTILIKMWGAGGAAITPTGNASACGTGGGAGYVAAVVPVKSGEPIAFTVGAALPGGGGASAAYFLDVTPATTGELLAIAGGGGLGGAVPTAGATSYSVGNGGAGGGDVAQAGQASNETAGGITCKLGGGQGGDRGTGGSGGVVTGPCNAGTAGQNAVATAPFIASGGGYYYGGYGYSGGGGAAAWYFTRGGAGGGAGYVGPRVAPSGVYSNVTGDYQQAANPDDPDRMRGDNTLAGQGGSCTPAMEASGGEGLGNSGRIVIEYGGGISVPSKFQLDAASYTVKETATGGSATIEVTRTGDLSLPASVDYATSPGTAVDGTDYVGTHGTLAFPAGATKASFTVTTRNAHVADGNLEFFVDLSNPQGVDTSLGSPASAPVTIDNDNAAGVFTFSAATYSITEKGPFATITVTRSHGLGEASVAYATSDGTATAGVNYVATSNTLTFPYNKTAEAFTVPIINTEHEEGTLTVNLALSSPSIGGTLGTHPTATLDITSGGYVAGALSVITTAANQPPAGSTSSIMITVTRPAADKAAGVSVNFNLATVATPPVGYAAAQPGVDFTPTSGTLEFGYGVSSQSFPVQLLNNNVGYVGNLVFDVELTDPTGKATATATTAVKLTAAVPTLQFGSATATADIGTTATIEVYRSGEMTGTITVDYATADGTGPNGAVAGRDYTAASNKLTFAPNVAKLAIEVPITATKTWSPDKTFILNLSSPSSGAYVGDTDPVTITIHNTNVQ